MYKLLILDCKSQNLINECRQIDIVTWNDIIVNKLLVLKIDICIYAYSDTKPFCISFV